MDNRDQNGLTVVVLAAGKGARMQSDMPKVLHPIGHKPLLQHVLEATFPLSAEQTIVVHGKESDSIKAAFAHLPLTWAEQSEPQGTGHAVLQALPYISADRVLILYGDVPLITPQTLSRLLDNTPDGCIGLLTTITDNPTGLGRIFRENGTVKRIIEERDATPAERAITEVNTGIFVVETAHLAQALPQLKNHNAQGEYYLTDIIAWAVDNDIPIHTATPFSPYEVMGINDRKQQVTLERIYQQQQAHLLLEKGTRILDPTRLDIRGPLEVQNAVTIDVNVILQGNNILRTGCHIGPHCVLINCDIGENVAILAHSYLEGVTIGRDATVGPFARLRPGTVLAENVRIGNFVEIKNAHIGEGSKVPHLSYIGDTLMGKSVNVGAGTITCNYDGKEKHKTIIEDDVHIGSDTQLIAPIRVGKGATLGAGTTLHRDAPAHQLTLTQRLEQRSKTWERPSKDKKE